MTHSDPNELEQLAMLAELARPLAHECNNFLNTFLLQLAIAEKLCPDFREEWSSMRREGKKLANLLQQWQRHRTQSTAGPTKIDLNQMMKETLEELRPEIGANTLHFHQTAEPLWLTGFAGEIHRLCLLLVRYTLAAGANHEEGNVVFEMHVSKAEERIHVIITAVGKTKFRWTDFDGMSSNERGVLSLSALTCISLVERLGGYARSNPDAKRGPALVIDLPFADL